MNIMSSPNIYDNGVNESGAVSPVEQQRRPSRYAATVGITRTWTRDNEKVMQCYLRSQPDKRGYRKRMIKIWQDSDLVEVSEQRLVDEVRQIKEKKWLSDLEIERIKRNVNNAKSYRRYSKAGPRMIKLKLMYEGTMRLWRCEARKRS